MVVLQPIMGNYGTVFSMVPRIVNTQPGTSVNMGNSTLLVVHHMQILC
jgi:hypothetical protein